MITIHTEQYADLDELIKKYNIAVEKKDPKHHQLCRDLAEALQHGKYHKNHLSTSKKWWTRWKEKLLKFIRRGLQMLKAQQVEKLNEEQKRQLEKLTAEYEAVSKEVNGRRMIPSKETLNRHHLATKNLAEFYTHHNLIR